MWVGGVLEVEFVEEESGMLGYGGYLWFGKGF